MKDSTVKGIIILAIGIASILCSYVIADRLNTQDERIAALQEEVQDIRDNYVSMEAVQPGFDEISADIEKLQDDIYNLDQRLIPVEDNQAFYKEVWKDYFGLEDKP